MGCFPSSIKWPKNEAYLWQTNLKANVCRNSTFQVNTRKNATWKRRLTSRISIYCCWVLWSMDCLQLMDCFVYSPRRGRFVNSAFPNKKNLAQQRSLFMTNKFESKCLQKFHVSSKHEKECYMKTTFYLEEPNRHFCQHFMRRTTQETFSAINLASQQKTTKLFFS